MVSRRPENPRRRALRRAADPGHDRQRLAGRPRSLPGGGHERPCGEADRQERLVLCLLGHLGRSGARGAPATAADAGELVEARGDIVGRFGGQPGADRPGVAALRSICRTSSPSSNASSARAMSGSAATLHTIKGSASTVGASAGRASELEQALRRADPLRGHGNPRRHPPRRTAHPVRCLPAPPAGDVRRRAGRSPAS